MIVSGSGLLRMRNVSDKISRDNNNTQLSVRFDCNLISPEYRAVYDIMWKNIVEPDRPHMTI
jgi:hypothetical protein